MRTGILVWSTLSGVVLGLFAGAALCVVAVGLGALLPARWEWLVDRLRLPVLLLCWVVLPLVGGVLGYLEGRLKLS